jgi:tetratricopeptide (TPR) repeat protein
MAAEAAVLYWGKKEFEAALARIRAARAVEPRRAEFIELEAWILRRLGRFDEFVDLWSRASRLDPLNADRARSLGDEATMNSRYGDALEAFLRAYRASPTEDAGDKYGVEVARVLASPDYRTWRRVQAEVLTSVRDNPKELREAWFGGLFIEQLYLSGQRGQAWTLLGRRDGEVVTEDFSWGVNSAYWEVAALSFLGEKQAALELGKKVLPATLEWEQQHQRVWNRSLSAIHKSRIGVLLERDDLVEDGLAYLRQRVAASPDAYWHRLSTYFYLEALVASDPALAQQIFLDGTSQVIPLHHFGLRPHIWYPLLDSPDVRALLDDHPKWVQFMRDRWPDSREFPFD